MSATMRAGYKQTEVGMIPDKWKVYSLLGACSKITDGTHDTPKPVKTGVPFLTAIHVKDNRIDYHECLFLTVADHDAIFKRCNPARGDVLMVNIGAGVATTALVNVDYEFSLKNVALLKPNSEILLGAYLNYSLARQKLGISQSLLSGGAQPFLSLSQIGQITIPVPTKDEQCAIAGALSDVDALLAKLDALVAKKHDLKQAAMQQLLTGQTRLPGFSGEWEVKRLGELFSFSGGHTASRDQLSETGYCYLHYGDIHLSKKTFIDVEAEFLEIPKLAVGLNDVSSASILKDGDVVFVDASEDDEGTSKHVVVVNPDDRPYISGLHTIVAKSKGSRVDNLFKRYCFQTRNIKEQFRFFAVGTKVSGISKTSVAKVELSFPTAQVEQRAIATILSDMDAELVALEARRDKTRALKQGMMQELLTGRIRLV